MGIPANDNLRFLKAEARPDDLTKAFAMSFPSDAARAAERRLLEVRKRPAWMQIRTKMAARSQNVAEVYGPPLYGIKTGLNDAFIAEPRNRATR